MKPLRNIIWDHTNTNAAHKTWNLTNDSDEKDLWLYEQKTERIYFQVKCKIANVITPIKYDIWDEIIKIYKIKW